MHADTTVTTSADLPGLPNARQIARKLATLAAVLAGGVLVIMMVPGLEELPAHLAGADPGWIAAALVLEILSTLSFSLAFHGAFDRRSTKRASTSMSLAVQGMNVLLPAGGSGGLAVGAVIMDRAGVPRSFAARRTVALFLVTSLASFVGLALAGFGLATGVLGGDVPLALSLLPALAAVAVIAGVAALPRLFGDDAPRPEGRIRGLLWSARVHLRDGVVDSIALLRSRDSLMIWGSIGYFVFDVAAIAASFHAVGIDVLPMGVLVLAYTLGHAGAIIPLPGSSEGGLIGAFVLFGAGLTGATAAILAYRAVHAGVPMILGVVGMADVQRLLRSGRPLHEHTREPAYA